MLAVETFILSSDRILPNAMTPQGNVQQYVGLPLLNLCRDQVSQGLTSGDNVKEFHLCTSRLSALGHNGTELLTRLLAARYLAELSPYADLMLDELRKHDEELVFEINKLTQWGHSYHMSSVSPLQYATLEGYKDVVGRLSREMGFKPQGGQNFGL